MTSLSPKVLVAFFVCQFHPNGGLAHRRADNKRLADGRADLLPDGRIGYIAERTQGSSQCLERWQTLTAQTRNKFSNEPMPVEELRAPRPTAGFVLRLTRDGRSHLFFLMDADGANAPAVADLRRLIPQ